MKPEVCLFSYAKVFFDDYGFQNGIWRFVLKSADGGVPFEAFDHEDGWHIDRLNLLSVVRGLESLEQPSIVTLYSASRYITRGFESSMQIWKKNDWLWERFGVDVPIKNQDLWCRLDHALCFHDVDCRFYLPHQSTNSANPPAVSLPVKRKRVIRPHQLEACG